MRYAILTFLWAVALVAYVQRSAISVPLQEIGRDLAVQDTWFGDTTRALGFLQSAWHLGYALLQIPAGRLADRIGGRRAIVLLAILWSLATAVTGFARSYWELVAAWTAMGALQAGVFPCAVRSLGQVFDDKERARASGWLGAGMLAGGAIAPVLTAWLLERFAPWAAAEGFARWRICLVLYCLPGLVWAAAYWLGTRERKGDRHLLLRKTSQSPGEKRGQAPFAPQNEPVPRAWADSSLWLLCGQQFLRAAAMIFFVTWFPTFLRETRGVSLMQSGLLTTYAGVAAMLGVICGGYASDWLLARTGSKRVARQFLAAVAMATCAVLIVVSSFVADVNAAIALISAGAFIACFGGVAGYTVAIDYGGDRVGTVFGAMNMAGAFGAMLFPVTVGWLVSATGTWNAALFTFAALMAIDAVLWAVLNPQGKFLEQVPAAGVAVAVCVVAMTVSGGTALADPPGYNADVRPILADKCFRCHGPDAGSREADLRLDRRDDAVALRDGRAAILPGDPAASTVLARIMSDDPDTRMPPPDAGPPLTAAERRVIAEWITAGAAYEPHWAFVPPVAAPPPPVRDASAIRHPADRFIQARLESLGILPEPEADPATLCRRLHFDIVGLPPQPAEVDAFVAAYAAADGTARERIYLDLVEQLLASPRYGERMAAPWLDAARYADTNGYQTDGPRQMWRYRDWVIEAFNRNQPFDEFTIDQIAGDLLPEPTLAQRIATGFNRNHRTNAEGGIIPAEFLAEYVVDRVETTCTVWLGLTAGCARCHDHKYDPLSQRDFYRLFDFFNRVPEPGKGIRDANSPPLVVAPTDEQSQRLAELSRESLQAAAAWQALEPDLAAAQAAWVAKESREASVTNGDFTLTEGLAFRLPRPPLAGAPQAESIDGPSGQAAMLTGTTPVPVHHVPPFDTERPFSGTVWLKPSATDRDATVFAAMDAELLHQGIELKLVQGRPQLVIANRILDDVIRVEAEAALPVVRWSHVTWTYDGSRLASGVAFHVDGKKVASRVVTDELSNRFESKKPLVLAGGGTAEGYRGGLAELRFYDRMLDPDESAIISCGLTVADLVQAAAKGTLDDAGRLKLRDWFVRHEAADELRQSWERMRATRRSRDAYERSLPTVMVMQDVPGLRKTHVLDRGLYDKPGEEVTAGVPEALGLALAGDEKPPDRLALARWLVDRRNPLTARVIVNRIWQQFFGLGLVKTVEDFGLQGDLPSHPALLDWLAVDFMDGGDGWDMKRLVRQIVTTSAYRRSSRVAAEAVRADPDNRLLARGPRFRLPAEMIRDAALSVSGLLVERIGGPSVKPYQPAGLWEELAASATKYEQDHGEALYRRSLYVYRKRTVAMPMFATFDAAGRETCQVRQSRTNTPLQALNLLNDVTFVEAARGLGGRMIREGGDAPPTRIAHGFRLATARPPLPRELETLVAGFERRLAGFKKDPEAARALVAQGESPIAAGVDPAELAAYATVGSVLLNLDEFLTRE